MSANWLPAMLADVLTIVTQGQVWTPPSSVNPNGVLLATFQVTKGQVIIDATNAIRRAAQAIQLIPYPMDPLEGVPNAVTTPDVNTDLLFPDGNEIVLLKGCVYSDGSTEYAQLGRLLMEDVEIYKNAQNGLYITLSGRDRGGTIDRAKFTVPYATDGISTLDVQLAALINYAVPNLPLSITPSLFVPAQMTFNINDSPWTAALALAASGGYELFPDAYGVITARPVINPQTTPVSVTYDGSAGNTDGIVTSIQRSLITTAIPNVIVSIAQGSNIPTPFISYWWDSNPTSPTFYNATVPVPGVNMTYLPTRQGSYPMTSTSQTNAAATTQEQNDTIAQSIGVAGLGTFETIDFKIRDNPAHDAEDVVGLFEPDTTVTSKLYLINTITVQMDEASEMEIKAQLVIT
jgi:hypothetical protein